MCLSKEIWGLVPLHIGHSSLELIVNIFWRNFTYTSQKFENYVFWSLLIWPTIWCDFVPNSRSKLSKSCAFHWYILRIWYCWEFVCFLQDWSKIHEETTFLDSLVRPLPSWYGQALPTWYRPYQTWSIPILYGLAVPPWYGPYIIAAWQNSNHGRGYL